MRLLPLCLSISLLLIACGPAQSPPQASPTEAQGSIDAHPTVEPVGGQQRLYFQAKRGENFDIYSSRVDGSDVKQLTQEPGDEVEPDISPDGTQLAFAGSSEVGGSGLRLFLLDLESEALEPLLAEAPEDVIDFAPAWSPDGTQIAFQRLGPDGTSQVMVVNSDGSDLRQVTPEGRSNARPAWFPDGSRIVYLSRVVGGPHDVYVIDVDGSNSQQLTSFPDEEGGPAVSPDGSQIAFVVLELAGSSLYLMNSDGSNPREVLTPPHGIMLALNPRWLNDDTLYFAASDEVTWAVFRVNTDGTDLRKAVQLENTTINYFTLR